MFTYAFNRRYDSIKANCLHPGFVPNSNLFRTIPKTLFKLIGLLKYTPLAKTPKQAAETIVYLAASPKISEGGKYFANCEEKKSSAQSYEIKTQEKLWDFTLKLLNLE